MLPSEQNTARIDKRIHQAAGIILGRGPWDTVFEHGHWWLCNRHTGAQYDVVDASGGRAVHGFDFEQVTEGD